MLRTRWQKVLLDLWKNRARTLIVALAIAVGVYAVGVVLSVRDILVREYAADQTGALPASAIIHTHPFDDELAERIAQVPGVAAAEGRIETRTRVYNQASASPGEQTLASEPLDSPRDLILVVIPDFEDIQVDAISPLEGEWPPGKREVILERQAVDYLGAAIGDRITVELDTGAEKTLTVVGIAHDPQELSPGITDKAYGYVTPDTMDVLGLDSTYTEMRIRVAEQAHDKAHILAVVDQVEEQLERSGREIFGRTVITDSHAGPFIDTIVLILSTFGLMILLLSGFLVVNAISALITQQVQQIGVMKLVGARRMQIIGMYVVAVLVYGVIAIAIGIPLAILTARLLMQMLVEHLLNIMTESYAVSASLVAAQAAIGLLLPLLAGLAPVIKGTRITTYRALNDVGVQPSVHARGWVERALVRLQRLKSVQRPLILAIRNTLRHRGRLVQTLVVLIVGTALFISVLSVRASVDATLDNFMRFHQYDVSVSLDRPYRTARLEATAAQVPGVVGVESWSVAGATRQRPNDTESDVMRVYAVPADTTFMAPEVSEGRWLPAESRYALVVNSDVIDQEPDLRVGDTLVLDIGGREAEWQIVGIVPTESRGPALYMDFDDYAFVSRTPGQATQVQVKTQRHGADAQREMEDILYGHFEANGFEVSSTQTTQALNSSNELMFTIVVAFLILMALLLAAVGGLGLTTTMSINILERVREIGVLRAIGASNVSVRRIVLIEGVVIGVLSWVIGTVLSLPVSAFMSEQVGLALIDVPLTYQYSVVAALVWFFVLQIVAVVASLGPARNAVRLTVREVLAYE
jgi:putative ABC transport system permease protein